jgi:hypothetical protein
VVVIFNSEHPETEWPMIAPVRNFEMTCYYVAPNFGAAWFSAKFFARFFEILSILGA